MKQKDWDTYDAARIRYALEYDQNYTTDDLFVHRDPARPKEDCPWLHVFLMIEEEKR